MGIGGQMVASDHERGCIVDFAADLVLTAEMAAEGVRSIARLAV